MVKPSASALDSTKWLSPSHLLLLRAGVGRVAVYCIKKMHLRLRKPGGVRVERHHHVLVFAGEERRLD